MTGNDHHADVSRPHSPADRHRVPSQDKQQVLDRIALQRERLAARRAARAQAATAAQMSEGGEGNDSLSARAILFVREHPVAVAAAAGVALMAGPARLIKWATVLLPILMRYKSR